MTSCQAVGCDTHTQWTTLPTQATEKYRFPVGRSRGLPLHYSQGKVWEGEWKHRVPFLPPISSTPENVWSCSRNELGCKHKRRTTEQAEACREAKMAESLRMLTSVSVSWGMSLLINTRLIWGNPDSKQLCTVNELAFSLILACIVCGVFPNSPLSAPWPSCYTYLRRETFAPWWCSKFFYLFIHQKNMDLLTRLWSRTGIDCWNTEGISKAKAISFKVKLFHVLQHHGSHTILLYHSISKEFQI